ncbi:unnamed protein product [Rhodiola kirilowii]
MANNTRLATLSDVEARTISLESGLKDLDAMVDRNHAELSQSIREIRDALEKLVARSDPEPKGLDRGKNVVIDGSGTSNEIPRKTAASPHQSIEEPGDEADDLDQ